MARNRVVRRSVMRKGAQVHRDPFRRLPQSISVEAHRYQLTRAARPLSIGLRSCLACLLPSSFKLAGHTVSGLEVRLGGWKSVAIAVFSEYVINNGVSHSLYRAYRHDKHARRRRFFDDFGTRFLAPLQASQTVSMMSVAGQNECRSLDAQRAKKPLRKLRRIIRITEPI